MKRFTTHANRTLAVGIIAAVAVLAPPAQAGPSGPAVPGALAVPDGHKVSLVGHAIGVQIYACSATAGGFGWEFVAPRADLYGDHGKRIATHYAGPTWEAKDGSKVVARRVAGVHVDATAVDWLLLTATETAPGADGDRLDGTTYIHRTATTGGLAPAASNCNASTAGTTAEVPYTADYHFWKATRSR